MRGTWVARTIRYKTHSQSAGTCVVGWKKKLRHSASVRLTCMFMYRPNGVQLIQKQTSTECCAYRPIICPSLQAPPYMLRNQNKTGLRKCLKIILTMKYICHSDILWLSVGLH